MGELYVFKNKLTDRYYVKKSKSGVETTGFKINATCFCRVEDFENEIGTKNWNYIWKLEVW